MLLACIGEIFSNIGVIGVVLSKRTKRNLIELWINNRDEENKIKIGERLRFILDKNPKNLTFYFKDHQLSMKVNILKNFS